MNTNFLAIAAEMSDAALLARVKLLSQRSREVTVELLAHLGEIDRRKLHRGEGPGKLFVYCTQVLRFSEAAAWNRIKAARAARRYPIVLDLLTDGRVNLTTIRLLAPHLTPENHRSLLAEAQGMTRRQVDKLVARLAPRPDLLPSIRKLPAARPVPVTATTTGAASDRDAPSVEPPMPETAAAKETSVASTSVAASASVAHRPIVTPLSPERYRLQITVGEEAHDDLRCLQDLLRREIPDGDAAAIVARALKALRQEVEKKTFAATSKPRPGRTPKAGSRHIPANVERAVWRRDGGQCAFVAKNGRRCMERSYIEYHHAGEHYAHGGEATVENISLRCRAHNVYESELIFGPYEPSRVRETRAVYATSIGSRTGPGTSSSVPQIVGGMIGPRILR